MRWITGYLPQDKKGEDMLSPGTLVVIILAIIIGLFLLYYAYRFKGRLLP